ncbi:MAG: glycoside hydrolase family 99-like domain-containing protein [Muribaculaceae bacterium]|nr:glycoside hydrolase family 99-like domain-containing protein [Muribaculaceae bacterium]
MTKNNRILPYSIPSYSDNDKWQGKDFTEWTNVTKTKPHFKGHYQPKIPADLGFYDLRLTEVREAQAELAPKGIK